MKRLVYPIAFTLLGLYLLLSCIRPFLTETAAMTPFFTSSYFAHDMLMQACGGLFYLASALQSCFAIPWLGSLLLIGLLVALAYTVQWAFHVPASFEGFCWLPSFALLVNYTQVGYMLYVIKTPGIAFAAPLGLFLALLLVVLWRMSNRWWIRVLWIALVSSVGYLCLGCFALIAIALVSLIETSTCLRDKNKKRLYYVFGAWLCGLVVPQLFYGFGLLHLLHNDLYIVGIPDFQWNDLEQYLFYPIIITLILLILFSVTRLGKAKKWVFYLSLFVFAVGGFVTYDTTFQDKNFNSILQMKQAAEQADWNRVLELSAQNKNEPTRLQVCLTRLALYEKGEMGDLLFTFPDGSAPYYSPRPAQYSRLIGGHLLYYYFGKTNFSYRWCMEDLVEYGERPYYLRYMAKVALMNGEKKLARKYLGALDNTWFYNDFSKKFNPYLDNEQLVEGDKEMKNIGKLLNYSSALDGDNGLVEFYLLNSFAYMEGGSREMVELSLMCGLVTKNINGFWNRFMALLPTWKGKIPVHYQEAALMIAQLQGNVDISQLPIDASIKSNFESLVAASSKHGDSNANRTLLRKKFGGTYWYYYFFIDGLNAN